MSKTNETTTQKRKFEMTIFSVKPETVNRLTNPNGEMINGSKYTGTIVGQSADNNFNKENNIKIGAWFSINYCANGFVNNPEANAEFRWFISEHEYNKYGIADGSFIERSI